MNAIYMKNITKKFGETIANNQIDFEVKEGEIHCLLGENGAGKTTLMKILFGLFEKDEGNIFIRDKEVDINGPREAIDLGIGMIHQHFMLVNRLSVMENIIAGFEPTRNHFIDYKKARKDVEILSQKYQMKVNPEAKIENISVGEQQRVEILKALYRKAEILILDEPTAVLTPQEIEQLFSVMNTLRENNETIIFITHKLKETLAISDRITVLRDGKKINTVETESTNSTELAELMVGREVVLDIEKPPRENRKNIFRIKDMELYNPENNLSLKNINFSIEEGEILGVAGVEGNGQLELEEGIMGLKELDRGHVFLRNREITNLSIREKRNNGIAYIPSDRLKRGIVEGFTLEKNLILGSQWNSEFSNKGVLNKKNIEQYSKKIIEKYDIKTSGTGALASSLSGGNQQKLVLGREFSKNPEIIIASQPTRGVDIGAKEFIHNVLLEMREKNKGILLISTELDELLNLSDRLIVLYEGEIVARGITEDFQEKELGLLMAGEKSGEMV
ncbi:MAG: ABC transporter ATP-binding protein [Bacillota bacterium]